MNDSDPLIRVGGAAGLAAAVLYLASLTTGLADAPSASASGAEVVAWATDHRSGLIVAMVLNLAAWVALVPLFALGLRRRLGGPAGDVAIVGALLVTALVGVIVLFASMLAFRAPGLAPGIATTLADGSQLATVASAWPTLLLMGAVLAARPPRLVGALAGVAFVAHLLGGVSLARSGAFSPTGTFAELAPLCFAGWLIATSAWLVRAPAPVALPVPA